MSTADNLRSAFAGESQANQTYTAYARKADVEGYPQIARLFRAAAAAEQVHAQAHLRVLDQVRGTGENIQSAIAGEASEFTAMYPGFVSEAEAEGNDDAVMSFKNALAVEKIHHRLYSEALKSLDAGSDLSPSPIFVCGVCGNTVPGGAPEKCPICGAPRKRFSEIA